MKQIIYDKQVLEIHFREGNRRINLEELVYIETNRHLQVFHTLNQEYSIYGKLGDFENALVPYGFVRSHQSFLVNMKYIEKISSYIMKLKNGQELSVPKKRYGEVKQAFAKFLEK